MRNFVEFWRKFCENFTERLKNTCGNYKKNVSLKNTSENQEKIRENFIQILRESCKHFEKIVSKF